MELLTRVAQRQAALHAAAAAAGTTGRKIHQQQRLLSLLSTHAALSSSSSRLQLHQTRSFAVQTLETGHLLQSRAVAQQHPSVQIEASEYGGDAASVGVQSTRSDGVVQSDSSVDALKTVLMASDSSFQEAYSAYETLRSESVLLREKHYLSLVYKACREGRYVDVKDVFDAFVEAEGSGQVLLPPRADRTWNYLSFERLQMHRFVLWSMLDARKYRQMNALFRKHVHGRPNKWNLFESDPLNFLLCVECTGRFADEQDLEWKLRVDKILAVMKIWRFNASYSSSHALFRFLLYHPDVFITQELARDGNVSKSTDSNHSSLTLGDVFVRYFSHYRTALRRDPKRISIAISAAAAAGQHDVVKAILRDAELHAIRIDAVSFAHAVECAESEEKRMEIVELYVKAKERNAIYTTQDEPASISNYLLLYAIFDGNFRHMMELLHEMQLYNNAASNKTIEELFKSVAKYRAQIRLEEQGDPEKNAAKLSACPTIEQLLNDFHNVIPRNVHTITQGIVQSLRSGDLQVALRLVRATVRTTDIVLRREIYAQLVYPLLARGSTQYDELELVEVERFYDAQHPRERVYLNAQVLNLCESNEDFVATLACLDRWQLQHHAPLSRRALQRVFDIVSKQLQQLRQQDADDQAASDKTPAAILVEGMELSYLAFLKRYFDIIPLDAWTFGNAIIRSGTSGLNADVVLLLHQAHDLGLVLEKAAYRTALQVLERLGKNAEICECVKVIEEHGVWTALVEKFPDVQAIAERARSAS